MVEATSENLLWEWALTTDAENLPRLRRLYDLLNVRFYLAPRNAGPFPELRQVGEADLRVYESPTAWPRAFFTDRVGLCTDAADLLRQAADGDGHPFAVVDAATLAETPGLAALRGRPPHPARLALPGDWRIATNETAFTVRAPSAGLVVLSETYQPRDFEVTVNGRPAPYFRVNHAFKAVVVDAPGVYRVCFRYRPTRWAGALWAAAAGLGVLLVWGWNLRPGPITGARPGR